MTTYEFVAALVGTSVGSGGLASWWMNRRSSKRDDFDRIVQVWSEDNNRLRKDIESLSLRIDTLETELSREKAMNKDLQNKLILLESAHHDLPFPQWLKDTNGYMLSLNKAYEDVFLKPAGKTASDYIGHTDEEIWGTEVAKQFAIGDQHARREKGYWIGIEPIQISGNDISERWKIVKYARLVGGVVVGIAGIAIPIEG